MMRSSHRRNRGAVLAIVILLIAGLLVAYLMLGLLPSTRKLDTRAAHRAASAVLDEALVRFAQVHQRLPCPANGGSGTSTDGTEDPASGATDCPTPVGPVPWTTLGLPRSAATDPHGRLYSYRVYDGANGFTRTGGLRLSDCLDDDVADVLALSGSACNATTHENTRSDFFCITVSGTSCTAAKGLTVDDRGTSKTRLAYVLLSHGASGYGAFLPDPTVAMTAPTVGGKEATNASDSTTYWILDVNDTGVTPDNVAHFDDVLGYKNVNDLVAAAKLGGRPWPLSARLDTANVGPYFSNNKFSSTATAANTTGGAMTITASASSARSICKVTTTDDAIAPCTFLVFSGADRLTTSGDERLTFEFRVARRFLRVKLTHFRRTGGNFERAKFTFYDGATQVHEVVKSACDTNVSEADATGRYLIDPGAQFTRVEVRADDSSTTTDFAVSSISGCKLSDAVYCTLRETTGTTCS